MIAFIYWRHFRKRRFPNLGKVLLWVWLQVAKWNCSCPWAHSSSLKSRIQVEDSLCNVVSLWWTGNLNKTQVSLTFYISTNAITVTHSYGIGRDIES